MIRRMLCKLLSKDAVICIKTHSSMLCCVVWSRHREYINKTKIWFLHLCSFKLVIPYSNWTKFAAMMPPGWLENLYVNCSNYLTQIANFSSSFSYNMIVIMLKLQACIKSLLKYIIVLESDEKLWLIISIKVELLSPKGQTDSEWVETCHVLAWLQVWRYPGPLSLYTFQRHFVWLSCVDLCLTGIQALPLPVNSNVCGVTMFVGT